MTDAHYVLSKALVFHVFTSIFFKSNLTSSSHLNLGLTLSLPPPDLPSSYFLTGLSPFSLTTCPSHSSLCTLSTVTVSGDAIYYKFVDSFLFSRTLKCELGKLLNSYHDVLIHCMWASLLSHMFSVFMNFVAVLTYMKFVSCKRCLEGFSRRIQKHNTDCFYKISLQWSHSILIFNSDLGCLNLLVVVWIFFPFGTITSWNKDWNLHIVLV